VGEGECWARWWDFGSEVIGWDRRLEEGGSRRSGDGSRW
jgi:hypothetical protein